MGVTNIIAGVVSAVVTVLAYLLYGFLIVVLYGVQNHPKATLAIFSLVFIYFAYKFSRRVIRIWLDLMITTIKTMFTISVVMLIFVIYLRGYTKLVNNDWPYLKVLWNTVVLGKDDSNYGANSNSWVFNSIRFVRNADFSHLFQNRNLREAIHHEASSYTFPDFVDYEFEEPSAYFSYAKENFGHAQYRDTMDAAFGNLRARFGL